MALTINPTVQVTDSTSLNLTNRDPNIVIQYISTVSYNIGANTTPQHVAAWIGEEGQPRNSEKRTSTGTFSNITSSSFGGTITFGFAAYNPGEHPISYVTKTFVPYQHLTCGVSATKPTTSGSMTAIIRGTHYNGRFGLNGQQNTLTLRYRYKSNSGSYGSWTTVSSPSYAGTRYTANISLTVPDYRQTYVVEVQASDRIESVTTESAKVNATPVFDWSSSDFNFNVPVNLSQGAELAAGEELSVLGSINIHNPETGLKINGVPMDFEYGTWNPYMNYFNASSSSGTFLRIGNTCIITWHIEGTGTSSTAQNVMIYNAPFTIDGSSTWYGGGGCFSNGVLPSNHAFCGWTMQSGVIYARTSPVGTTGGAGNVKVQSGTSKVYCAGTMMYRLASW